MSGIWTLPLLFHAFLLIADIPKNDPCLKVCSNSSSVCKQSGRIWFRFSHRALRTTLYDSDKCHCLESGHCLPLLLRVFLLIADIPKNVTICLADSSLQFWQATICSVSNLLPILFFSSVFGKEIFNLYFREWNLEHPGFHYIVCRHDDYNERTRTSQIEKLKKTSQLLAILFVLFIQLSGAAVLFQEGDSAEFSETRLPYTTDCNLDLKHGSGVMYTLFLASRL